jgi:acyl-CoA thioester hydrolase
MSKPGTHKHPDVSAIRELPALASQVIPRRWEDQNGHVNVGFYLALYNDSGWPMLGLIGVDEAYFTERKMGLVDLDNHIRYLRELHVGDRVTAYGRFFGKDEKRMHGMVFIVNDDTKMLASTIEFLSISIDLRKRKPAAIPDDVASRLDAVINAHQKLSWTVPTCMSILANKKSSR